MLIKKCVFYKKKNIRLILMSYLMCSFYIKQINKISVDVIIEQIRKKKVKKRQLEIKDIINATMFASRNHPYSKCLDRALVLAVFLRKSGFNCMLNVGLEEDNPLEGHAWIEMNIEGIDKVIDLYNRKNKLIVTKAWCI